MTNDLDLIGIGNAIVDILVQTDEDFIQDNQLNKGVMTLIEAEEAKKIYDKMAPAIEISGGSVANTIAAFASLGGKCGFVGKVADDQLGEVFRHDIRATGALYETTPLNDSLPTARCLIMVTPDAERTMCTFLGASVWITPSDIKKEFIQRAKTVYMEGYLFDKPKAKQAFLTSAKYAHETDGKVALSLSDPFCVERHREEFQELIHGHIDILFANEDELKALYKTEDLDVAIANIKDKCEIAAITRGKDGATILANGECLQAPAEHVKKVIDTTGAGDLYAAGFLYGYTRGEPMEVCAKYGAVAAAAIIQHMGARLQDGILMNSLDKKRVVYG